MPAPPTGRVVRRGFTVVRRLLAFSPRTFAVAVVGAMVYGAATVASSWVLGRVVDRVVIPRFEQGRVSAGAVAAGAAAIVAVGVVKGAGIVVRRVFAGMTQFAAEAGLQQGVVERYHSLPTSWHRAHPTGELLAHAGSDAEVATSALAPLPYATGVAGMLAITAAWMLATDLYLAAVGLAMVPTLVALNLRYQRAVEGPSRQVQAHIGRVSAIAHESFDGALVVKSMGAEDAEAARFSTAASGVRDAAVRVAEVQAAFNALLDAVPSVATIAVLVVGAWRVESGAVSPGTLVAFVNLLTLLVWPLRLIGYLLSDLSRTVAGYDRIDEVLREPIPAPPRSPDRLPAGPLGVEVDHLTFAYEAGAATLADVAFTVAPGSTVALVGPTGAGKTTLLLLLARLLDPTSGAVHLGGADLRTLAADDLTAAVALAFQEPFLFGTTVLDNIVLGSGATADDAVRAARLARVDDFVDTLPDGYDTVVGERGATLSGGQRQRLALARALVRNPRLLLLDDATSAVDPTTEAAILSALRTHLGGTTTVMVATRPATVALADEVLFLDRGRLVARGPHATLLASVPGYARLLRAYDHVERSS